MNKAVIYLRTSTREQNPELQRKEYNKLHKPHISHMTIHNVIKKEEELKGGEQEHEYRI